MHYRFYVFYCDYVVKNKYQLLLALRKTIL